MGLSDRLRQRSAGATVGRVDALSAPEAEPQEFHDLRT